MASILDALTNAVSDNSGALAQGLVRGVTVETQLFPTFTYVPSFDSNGQPVGESGASAFSPFALLKPRITLDLVTGPLVLTPAGAPTANYVPYTGAVLSGLVAAGAFALGRRSFAKKAGVAALALAALGYALNRGASSS